ncbi:MAG: T9SS type A sorting domain-containing protein [Saprospiraceae bacterium]|nr:T9SS type A sorting domain-containing protein [Saprospiraceae bacterium]
MRIINLRLRAALGLGLLLLAFILLPSFIENPVVTKDLSYEFFDGGDFSLNFAAAAPFTYDHDTGGGAFNDGTNAETGDVREELQGGNYACGDIVTYLQKIVVNNSASDVDQVLELSYSFTANTTGQPGAAHIDVVNIVVNYGNVENGDDGTGTNPGLGVFGLDSAIDDDRQSIGGGDSGVGGSTIEPLSEVFDPTGTIPFGTPPAEELLLKFRVHDLDPAETIIVRIDVKISCDPGSSPTGNLQGKLGTAHVVEANGLPVIPPDAAGSGAQTINFKQIGQLSGVGEPLVNIQKTVTTPNGSCPGEETLYLTTGATVQYCYSVTNPGTTDLFDVEVIDDKATPGDTSDDEVIALNGLADIDGDGDLGDLASGATATGTFSVSISSALGATINKAVATGNNGLGGGLYEDLMDMDIATVVVCNLACETDELMQASNPSALDGVINAKGLGGTSPYTYSWENEQGTIISTSDVVTGLGVGTYNVTVTDALGCTAICSQTVTSGSTVPVILSDFKAELKEGHVLLTWNTLTEVNNAGFYVEKNLDGQDRFNALEFIKGQNSSRTMKKYKYVDELSSDESLIYYRLRQVDYDGNAFYSDVRTITRSKDPSSVSIYPNPTTGILTISIPEGDKNSKIRVYNTVGQLVDHYAVTDGITSTQVDLSTMERGIYLIHLSNNYTSYLKKVILNY